MTTIETYAKTFQSAAISGIRRKITGDYLAFQKFFQFLFERESTAPDFLAFVTNRGLLLNCHSPYISRNLSGYTVSSDTISDPDPCVCALAITDKLALLYSAADDRRFDCHRFAAALKDLISISGESQNLMDWLDAVDNTICIYDKESFLLYANESYCRHFNIANREDAIGLHIYNLTAQAGIQITATKTRSNNLKMMDVLKNGKKILDWEIMITPENLPGNANSIINNMYPYKTADGNIEGLVEISSMQNINLDETRKILGMSPEYTFDSIVGESPAMLSVKKEAMEYSDNPYNLLIVGESGVGKELFAQAVHNYSSRRNGPFIAINCASLPENLIESELFGYVGGAFTGASKNGQAGKFELADGGTLFLDEIGEMPIQFQPKLLRVLETRTVMRIGGSVSKSIDVRVIAATNRNLPRMIEEGFFREDLYYRLQVLNILIPPLRNRREDALLLMNTFLKQTAESTGDEVKSLSPEAEQYLLHYHWPGNVRELRNVAYRLSLLSKGETISPEDIESAIHSGEFSLDQEVALPAVSAEASDPQARLDEMRDAVDNAYAAMIREALSLAGGKKQKAADLLQIDRKTLYRMIKKYNVEDS